MVQKITILAFFAILAVVASRLVPFKHYVPAAKRPQDPCRICDHIIRRAENHFANGSISDSNQLLRQLERECIQLANTEGDDAAVACINMVQSNIAVIYNDVQAHKPANQVCQDIGQCPMNQTTGATPSWNVTVGPTVYPTTPGWNVTMTPFPGNSTDQTQGWNFTTTAFSVNASTTAQQWNVTGTDQPWNFTTTAFPWNVTTSDQGWNFTTGSSGNMTTPGQQWNVTVLPTTGAPTFNSTVSTENNTVAHLLERLQSAKNVFVFTLN